MVAAIVLLDTHAAALTRALLGRVLDHLGTGIIFNFPLAALALVVFFASLSRVECFVVRRADQEVAGTAAEDVALYTAVMDLTRVASGAKAVTEVRDVAEEASGGKFVVSDHRQLAMNTERALMSTYLV
jgi:hypothetical protein